MILVVELEQRLLAFVLLGEHTARRHFADVGGREIVLVGEPVSHFGDQHALLIAHRRRDLVQLLLGRDDQPDRRDRLACFDAVLAFPAEELDYRAQVFETLLAVGDILADLIHDEDERLPFTTPRGKLERALDQQPWCHVDSLPSQAVRE